MAKLSHLDSAGRPTMVDVSDKVATRRTAVAAEHRALAASRWRRRCAGAGFRTAKGPVFDTAIVAGVMAAKRTHELIPFCHPLGIENCRIEIHMDGASDVLIRCTVSVHHKTGVEMEALTGACDRGPDHLRHVQGAVARHRDRRDAPARKARRQERNDEEPRSV